MQKRFTEWSQRLKKKHANLLRIQSGAAPTQTQTQTQTQASSAPRTPNDDATVPAELNKIVHEVSPNTIALAAAVSFLEEAVLELSIILPYNETFQR